MRGVQPEIGSVEHAHRADLIRKDWCFSRLRRSINTTSNSNRYGVSFPPLCGESANEFLCDTPLLCGGVVQYQKCNQQEVSWLHFNFEVGGGSQKGLFCHFFKTLKKLQKYSKLYCLRAF